MDCSLLASFHLTVYLLQFHLYSFFYLLCVTCRNLIVPLFLELCHCVILSIWSLQMRTSIRALTMSMTKLLLNLSAIFSRSNALLY